MTVAALEIQDVVVSYGDAEPVLKGVSLSVTSGEFIALLGASGCGKTTLLRAVSGFVRLRAGAIRVSGVDITGLPPDKRDMAMVFQSYALWPHMTTAQNIGYGLRLRRKSRSDIARRVGELLSMLGMEGLGERKVTQLSGGQRQRVALGRALAVNPRILLLDEPLSNLDARVRGQMRHEIKAIQQNLGITAIHVTHDREEAMVMADRIVILNEGYIVQQGTPEEVYNRPATPFVASFTGANNVVALHVGIEDGFVRVAAGEHNAEALLRLGSEGAHLAEPKGGPTAAHFHTEAARLVIGDDAPPNSLTLRGRITQNSYPGGIYRYAVDVGGRQFMVDDERRFSNGDEVGIWLPAEALHLYPATPEDLTRLSGIDEDRDRL
ncbi:MAG: ABC transporter ATP-binding protein [Proteobacteria bacterium]|nr:ABC transporter ATP-binding protein [Pseudomonadota bacterium]